MNQKDQLSLERAWILYQLRRYEAAFLATLEFLTANPNSAEGHCLLSFCSLKNNDFVNALRQATTAIGLSPQWGYPYYVHACVAYGMEEFVTAAKSLGEAIRIDPTNSEYYELSSSILLDRQNFEQAIKIALIGLENDPQHIGCLQRLGIAQYDSMKLKEARVTFERVMALDPEDGIAMFYLGAICNKEREFESALPLLRQVLQKQPEMTLVQDEWKTAMKGQYTHYASVINFKEKFVERYFWFLLASVVIVTLLFTMVFSASSMVTRVIYGLALGGLIGGIGLKGLICATAVYLDFMGEFMLIWNKEIRRTISLKNWLLGLLAGILICTSLFIMYIITDMHKQ